MEGIVQNAVAQQNKKMSQVEKAANFLQKAQQNIIEALPNNYDPERFKRIAINLYSANVDLQGCDFMTFIGALMTAAQLGLEPNTPMGYAYIIPRGNRATFCLGYQGILNLAYRSPKTALVYGAKVRENDEYEFLKGTEIKVFHRMNVIKPGKVLGYYGVYKTVDGFSNFEFMTLQEIEEFRKQYVKGKSTAWQDSFDAMAMKTVIRQTLKFVPKDVEIQKIFNTDNTVRDTLSKNMDEVPVIEDEEIVEEN